MSAAELDTQRSCHAHRCFRLRVVVLVAALVSNLVAIESAAAGTPSLEPGDAGIRHDLQLLVDEGLLDDVALTVWPMSWPQVLRALDNAGDVQQAAGGARAAFARVERQARRAGRS